MTVPTGRARGGDLLAIYAQDKPGSDRFKSGVLAVPKDNSQVSYGSIGFYPRLTALLYDRGLYGNAEEDSGLPDMHDEVTDHQMKPSQ